MKHIPKFWIIAGTLILVVVLYTGILLTLFWGTVPVEIQNSFIERIRPEYLFIILGPPVVLVFLFLNSIANSWIRPTGKLSEETSLILNANPSHRIDPTGSIPLRNLTDLINKSADKYQELSENVREKIEASGRQLEEEKNTLAAFISELSEGVLICRNDGRILLYNKTAREFFSEGNSDAKGETRFIGLGRSVFALIDKTLVIHALDTISSKLASGEEHCVSTFVIIGDNRKQLKVEAVPILDSQKTMTGFIFLMSDITSQLVSDKKADIMLQNLIKDIRASLGGIRAAVETIMEFPDMKRDQRDMFTGIVHKEAKSLGETIDRNQEEYSAHLHSKWPLVHMYAADLAVAFKTRAEEKLGVHVAPEPVMDDIWIRADNYSLTTALLFLGARIREQFGVSDFSFKTSVEGKFVHIDLLWEGPSLKIEILKKWNGMALMVENEGLPMTLDEVTGHHDADLLPRASSGNNGMASLTLLLPVVETQTVPVRYGLGGSIIPEQRPEFYDFDLFDQVPQSEALINTPLTDLTYTIFDTETTGLNPSGGDEIISIGAVRVVNMKLINDDIFDRLIDPKRSVPEISIKIHGIQPEMLEGQPEIGEVLPQFHQYTEDTVLVGHNVAFDMAMLKAKEEATGIRFVHPVLDTLLLSTVVNPEQQSHNIEAITRRLGISVIGRHTAVGDAITTAEMFIKMIHLLSEAGIHTLGEAIEASKRTYYARLQY